MTQSILPANTLPNGGTLVLNDNEEREIVHALEVLTPRRVRRAFGAYSEERKQVDGAKAQQFLWHVGVALDKRGLSPLQVQLINVTAAQSWEWFRGFLNRWLKVTERAQA